MQKDKITFSKLLKSKQKGIIIALFAISIILFLYSLLFMTPFYDMYLINDTAVIRKAELSQYGIDIETYKQLYPGSISYSTIFGQQVVSGVNAGYFSVSVMATLQAFNKTLFAIAFFGIVGSLILFIYRSQLRKRYYITNFISIGIVIAFDLFASIFTLVNIFSFMKTFSSDINYEILNVYQTMTYNPNTDGIVTSYFSFNTFSWVFILGIVLCAICILIAVYGIVFLVKKYLYQKEHPALDISGVVINE